MLNDIQVFDLNTPSYKKISWEALEEILYYLEECQTMGIREISIIHGYHGGKVLTPPVKKHYNIIVPNSEVFFNFLLSYILIWQLS